MPVLNCYVTFSTQVAVKIIDKTQLNPTSLQKVCFLKHLNQRLMFISTH